MVEVFQDSPCGFLNFITGENHIYAGINRIFYLNRQGAGVTVQILSFTFESIESVCILQVQCCNTSHIFSPYVYIIYGDSYAPV